jgi:hypothetical protein
VTKLDIGAHFKAAYREVMCGVNAPHDVVEALLRELLALFDGHPDRVSIELVDRALPPSRWLWPEFHRQLGAANADRRADILVHRIWRLAYAKSQQERFESTVDFAPYKMFSAVMDDRSPAECKALNGTARHHADPFWKDNPVPCARLDCRCTWIALSKRDLERLGKHCPDLTPPQPERSSIHHKPTPALSKARADVLRWLRAESAKLRQRKP